MRRRFQDLLREHIGRGKGKAPVPVVAKAIKMPRETLYSCMRGEETFPFSKIDPLIRALGLSGADALVVWESATHAKIRANPDLEYLVDHLNERGLRMDANMRELGMIFVHLSAILKQAGANTPENLLIRVESILKNT